MEGGGFAAARPSIVRKESEGALALPFNVMLGYHVVGDTV